MDEKLELEQIKKLKEIASSDRQQKMDEFLAHQPPEVQLRIRKTVDIWNVDPEDPFFQILIDCKITQILYELTPNRINKSFDTGLASIEEALKRYQQQLLEIQQSRIEEISQAALKQSISKLDRAIARVLEDNNLSHKKGRFSPRVIGSMVTAGAIVLSLTAGFVGGRVFDRTEVAKDWSSRQATQDRLLLKWAKSSRGQFAKNLLEWNEDLYDKSCQRKIQNLGITFTTGSLEMVSGFCVVHVVPEKQRQYRERE